MRGLLAILLLVTATACAAKPLVEVEHPRGRPVESSKVSPPQCEEIPLPPYPDVERDERPEQVTVKVTFTIDKLGRTEEVSAERVGEVDRPEPYLAAAVDAARTLRCKPAARLAGESSETLAFQPIPYRSSFVYHFFRDEKKARVAGSE
jgi:hypothetical protein